MRVLKIAGWFILSIFIAAFLFFVLTAVGPDGKAIVSTTKTTVDTVINIYEGGTHDIVFSLKNNEHAYYINRGLEHGLNIDSLKQKMLHKSVTISYASPMSHINELSFNDEIVYSELRHSH